MPTCFLCGKEDENCVVDILLRKPICSKCNSYRLMVKDNRIKIPRITQSQMFFPVDSETVTAAVPMRLWKLRHSAAQTFRQCKMKFFWEYCLGLKPVDINAAMDFGSSVHQMLESGIPEPTGELKQAKAIALASKLRSVDIPVVEREIVVAKEIDGVVTYGTADGIGHGCPSFFGNDEPYLVEYKTVSDWRDDFIFNSQVVYYAERTGLRQCAFIEGKKPLIRQKKDESESEFLVRYNEAIEVRATPLFIEERIITRYAQHFLLMLDDIRQTVENNSFYQKWGNCRPYNFDCIYLPLCDGGTPDGLFEVDETNIMVEFTADE